MKEQNDVTKVEFLITLNNNFVVQRFFNVKGYNENAENSVDLYDYVKYLSESLQTKLRNKCMVYMLDNRYQIEEDPSILETSNTDGPEIFNIILKVGNKTICHRIIDAKLYPPKVRYTLDIRPDIKNILRELTDILSEKNLSYRYLNYSFA
jgi:hypothetical protein